MPDYTETQFHAIKVLGDDVHGNNRSSGIGYIDRAGTELTATFAEINAGVDGLTATAAELNKLDGIDADAYPTVTKGVSFTEAGDTTYTGTIEIPAGAILWDIIVLSTVLWDDGTSASMVVGDDDDPNGWFDAINLKATDLLVGEVLRASDGDLWGGKEGAYLVAATGRRGRTTAGVDSGLYYGAASEVIGVVTTGAQNGTAGRTFMFAKYSVPTVVAATGA